MNQNRAKGPGTWQRGAKISRDPTSGCSGHRVTGGQATVARTGSPDRGFNGVGTRATGLGLGYANTNNVSNVANTPTMPNKSNVKKLELQVIQTNLHKAKNPNELLDVNMTKLNTDVALITEPYCARTTNRIGTAKGTNVVYPPSTLPPRACIKIKNELPYTQINELSTRDCVAIRLESTMDKSNHIILASIYIPPDYDLQIPTPELANTINYANKLKLPLIIGMDSNAHHQAWGNATSNKRGESLLEYLATTNMAIMNKGNEPTFENSNGSSVIDLTCVTSSIANKIEDWEVSDEESLSDHKYITYSINCRTNINHRSNNIRKTNWSKYRKILEQRGTLQYVINYLGLSDIDTATEKLTKDLTEAQEEAVPRQPTLRWNKKLKEPKPW